MPAALPKRPRDVRAWLDGEPSLEELQEAYPSDWAAVQKQLAALVPSGDREALTGYIGSLGGTVSQDIRRAMALAAVRRLSVAAATGVSDGRVRFNLVNGKVMQKLLFEGGGFTRKPVSMGAFKLLWPLLWQRRFLMPLVAKKGIYCFYSQPLVSALAELIGGRQCVEIAAGDGTLTRFLRAAGVKITATDDKSWKDVDFPDSVVREDAKESLKKRRPQAVICSWPPAENSFERAVFRTKSVELYIVVGSRHKFAAGNWAAYEQQTAFEYAEAPELSKLVLPPELDAAVFVFRRSETLSV
jgi:hypothetical protein